MSIPNFPNLPGLGWPVDREIEWSTILQKSQSGKKSGIQLYTFPEYKYTIDIQLLRTALTFSEFQTFWGFIESLAGQSGVFYWPDADDYQVTAQPNGVGDGITTSFQLYRTLGGSPVPVQSPTLITQVTVNGAPTTAFTLGAKGIITFASAPPAGQEITWTGTYVWLCRLDDDSTKFSKFTGGRYEAKSISFTTEKL